MNTRPRGTVRLDAGPYRTMVRTMQSAWTMVEIARATGLKHITISELASGATGYVDLVTARAITAVHEDYKARKDQIAARAVHPSTSADIQRLYADFRQRWLTGEEPCTKHPEWFFNPDRLENGRRSEPDQTRRSREAHARQLCGVCPIRRACLQYAIDASEPSGIWGGLNRSQRTQLATRRKREGAA